MIGESTVARLSTLSSFALLSETGQQDRLKFVSPAQSPTEPWCQSTILILGRHCLPTKNPKSSLRGSASDATSKDSQHP